MDELNQAGPKPVVTKTVSVPKSSGVQVQAKIETPIEPVAVEKITTKSEPIKPVEKEIVEVKAVEKEAEKPEVEKTPEEKKEEKETARWAALAKQERKLELERSTFKTEMAETKKQVEATKAENAKFQAEILSIKNNPKLALDILDKLGIPFTTLANYVLNPETVDKDYEVKRLKDQYESDKANKEKAEKETQTAQQKANVEAYKSNLKKFIDGEDGNNNAYPLIRANDEHDLVYQVMDERFRQDGTEMQKSDAAKMVEDHLQEKLDKQIQAKKLKVSSDSESISETEKTVNKEVKAKKEVMPQKAISKVAITKPNLTSLKQLTVVNPNQKAQTKKERYDRAIAAFQAINGKK